MIRPRIKQLRFIGLSAAFHLLLLGVTVFALSPVWIPEDDFPEAIFVDLVLPDSGIQEAGSESKKPMDLVPPLLEKTGLPPQEPAPLIHSEHSPGISPSKVFSKGSLEAPPQDVSPEKESTTSIKFAKADYPMLPAIPRSALDRLVSAARRDPGKTEDEGSKNEMDLSLDFDRFLSGIRSRLEESKRYPFLARLRGQEGTVHVAFRINRAGKPEDIHVVKESGWPLLNQEAFKTVQRVERFNDPPENWKEDTPIRVPLAFRLKGPSNFK